MFYIYVAWLDEGTLAT